LRISAQIGLCDAKIGAIAQIIFMPFQRPARAPAEHVHGCTCIDAKCSHAIAAKKKR
jgi:hypothetical protein